jgi:hypothetical protein
MFRGLYNRLFALPVAGRAARPTAKQSRPLLETLEDRTAPAVLNLTSAGASGWINGAFFEQVDPQATGTGLIQSFVRIQRNPATEGTEQGYNTDFRDVQFDEKSDHTFTHSIRLNDIQTENINGTKYLEFWLDINETKPGRLLSLDQLQVSIAGSGDLTGYTDDGTYGGQATPVYDMDGAPDGDSRVDLDYFLNHGSGSGDLRVLIPKEACGKGNPYVYLYSHFGDKYEADSGFEEWWVLEAKKGKPPTFDISGMKFNDVKGDGVKDATDPALKGWEINLYEDKDGDGEIDAGEYVTSTTTAADGSYSFTGLDAFKQYIVAETQQGGWIQTFGGGPEGDGPYTVYLNDNLGDVDFGNFERIDISGTKFNDKLGDGITSDDSVQGGFTIDLYKETNGVMGLQTEADGDTPADTLSDSTKTAADGSYSFNDLGPGTYYVQEEVPDGWMQTYGGTYTIEAMSGVDSTGNDFANFELIDISGMKFRDLDREGDKDPGEPGVGGITIELYKESNGVAGLQTEANGDTPADTLFDSTTTASDGTYSFEDLGPGTYYTQEVVPSNWIQTFGGTYTTVAMSGVNDTDNDFGNVEIGGGGAHTLGYWSNQNGQTTIEELGGWNTVRDDLADLNLRNADGSLFDVAHSTYDEFRSWLLGGNGVNMAYMLSVQAVTMKLNVMAGEAGLTDPDGTPFNTGDAVVYAPGVIDGQDFITVDELLGEATKVLYGNGEDYLDLTSDSPDRGFATLLKTALDDANNNKIFVVS